MANLTKLRDLAYKYQHAINYREDSPYWRSLIFFGLCNTVSGSGIPYFVDKMGYSSRLYAFPIVVFRDTTSPEPKYYRGYAKDHKIKDVAKEVLQPRLDLLEQFIIELEIQNETLQELSERRD